MMSTNCLSRSQVSIFVFTGQKPEQPSEPEEKPEEKPEVNIDDLVNFDNFDTKEDAERAAKVALTKDEFKEFNSFVVKQGHDGKWYVRFKFIEEIKPEEKPQNQTTWRQERLKPQSSKDIDLSNFDMDTPLSEKEKELVKLINDYRISLGKRPLNVSKSLTYVARTHTKDQILHFEYDLKDERGLPANLHSWSKYGNWTPVMYTDDHEYGQFTRIKPQELTQYNFGAVEISVGQQNYDQVHQIAPNMALNLWKNSPGHNKLIVRENILYNVFHADQIMGVSIHDGFANVWFGNDPTDPAGFHITYEK